MDETRIQIDASPQQPVVKFATEVSARIITSRSRHRRSSTIGMIQQNTYGFPNTSSTLSEANMSSLLNDRAIKKLAVSGATRTSSFADISRQYRMDESTKIRKDKNDSKLEVLRSIRNTIRSLPQDRYDEIFSDFESALKSQNINFLADTIANWSLGGKGYEYAGIVVNPFAPILSPNADKETIEIWDSFWSSDD